MKHEDIIHLISTLLSQVAEDDLRHAVQVAEIITNLINEKYMAEVRAHLEKIGA